MLPLMPSISKRAYLGPDHLGVADGGDVRDAPSVLTAETSGP
jgi:hypothetical protein